MSFKRALRTDSIAPGETRAVQLDDERILICKVASGELFALADCCSHDGGILGQGALDGQIIECPRHGGRFDVATGAAVRMPAIAPIDTFALRTTEDGWLEIDLEDTQ